MGVIIEYQYFPPVILFNRLCSQSHLLLEQYENFQKMSFRNRTMVAGAGGPILLSIPLKDGRNQKSTIKDVRIENRTSWQGRHWKTIVSCYNKSPWFEHYRDELNELYKTPHDRLIDWNLACFNWILDKLEMKISVSLTVEWKDNYDPGIWEDWRNRLSPNSIHTKFPVAREYSQVFGERTGFIPHLSILDLLFCEGKNARSILCDS